MIFYKTKANHPNILNMININNIESYLNLGLIKIYVFHNWKMLVPLMILHTAQTIPTITL